MAKLSLAGSPAPGQAITARVTIKNAGKAKAKASQTVVVLSKDRRRSKDDRTLSSRKAKALAARKTAKASLRLTIPASAAPGRYSVIVCTDARAKVKEANEKNNCRAAALTVVPGTFGGPGGVPGGPSPGGPITGPGGGDPGPGPQPTPSATPTATPTATPDTRAPETTITAGPAATNDLATAVLEFSADEAGATFECRLDAGAWGACTSPKTYDALAMGQHTFAVRAKDAAGNVDATPATRDWARFPAPPLPLPEDPQDVAPEPAAAKATSVAEGTKFLYSAAGDTIQDMVDEDEMAPRQAAVLRGKVLRPDGPDPDGAPEPMPKARVTVLDHPEYGYTTTRDDGGYDLAVNGGETLTLRFEQGELEGEQYASVQRTLDVPWQDFVDVEDVEMTAYTDAPKVIDQDATGVQVAASQVTPEDDADPRKATLMFEPKTSAEMELPDGSTQEIDELKVRATEYTAGPTGDQRMPGDLPPSSAYTYAVEFSVDEAVEAGATDVKFDKPVTTYVDNFLGFEAGTIVPSAYYDEGEGAWVPSENGIVVDVLREEDGKAIVDVDGDGGDATPSQLSELGIDATEQQKLADQYGPGDSLWRVKVKHFTPWDYNWPYGCKADCDPPDEDPPPPPYCPECQAAGSIVGLFNQTLGERIDVTGTPFALHYESGRVPGYKEAYRLEIPLTGPSIKPLLRRVELEVTVAGRVFRQTFAAEENLDYTFTWDGLDAYGRRLEGAQNASVRIGYVYPAEYLEPDEFEASFGQFGGRPVTRADDQGDETRREIITWQEWERPLGTLGAGSDALGGWTVDVHHAYDPQARVLHLGDGGRVTTEAIRSELRTVAGVDPYQWWDEGTEATQTDLGTARGTDVGADGSIYIAQTSHNAVLRVTPDGEVETVAGGLLADRDAEDLGDGGPADRAQLLGPRDVEVAPDGTVYIADTGNGRIRRVGTDGAIRTFAGGGDPDVLGDGGAATAASLRAPRGLALGADGTLFVAEASRDRVRRITPDGRISTAAGGGAGALGDGGPANEATLDLPTDVAIDAQGTLYIADALHNRVRRVDATGAITTIAGDGGGGSSGDGGPATDASIGQPYGLDVATDGTVYVSDRLHHEVRRIGRDGRITAYAGTGERGGDGDGGAPLQAHLSFPEDVTVAPDGSVHIADTGNARIRRVSPGLPGFTDAAFSLPSEDGTEVYQFNADGRHLRTVEALTGAVTWSFGYDGAGRLVTITDGSATPNVTTIERDGTGAPEAIVAPGGIRTELALDTDGYLKSVADPAGEAVTFGYFTGGLLKSLTDPLGKAAGFTYDAGGRLVTDTDKRGKTQRFDRVQTATGFKVTRTSPEGLQTIFESERLPGGDMRTTTTDPSGAVSSTRYGQDGRTRMTAANGTATETTFGPDPRWGMRAPIPTKIVKTTPAGRSKVIERTRDVQLAAGGDPFAVEELTDHFTIDGRSHTRTYDGAARTVTSDGEGTRRVTQRFDARGRLVERGFGPGVQPIGMTYDDRGRLTAVTQGDATRTYTYDGDKPFRLVSRTDEENRTVSYGYDAAERVNSITLPGGRQYGFGYDANGNRTSITMPSGKVHGFGHDAVGAATSYTPPGGSAWTRTYDDDGVLSGIALPGGHSSTPVRDTAGRKTGVSYGAGEGSSTFTLENGTDLQTEATRTLPGRSDTEATGHDGVLDTSRTLSDASGQYASYGYEYGADLELDAIELKSGGDTVRTEIERDSDGLPTSFGPFTLTREGPLGRVSAVSDDDLQLDLGWDGRGRAGSRTMTVAGTPVYDTQLTWDKSNRLVGRTETIGAGAQHTYAYTYLPSGELDTVTLDGTKVEDHSWDVNGNRTTGGAVYGDDDVLDRTDAADYSFDAAGFLTGRGTDTFSYSTNGELLQATVGGTTVTYSYDTLGRRTARTQGGETTRYLYGNPAAPYQVTGVRSGGQLTTYYYGRGDALFALERGGRRYYVATDQVGTPKAVADADGAIVKTLAYDTFGKRTPAGETGPGFELPIGFAGGLEDPLTGLVRFGQRDYDPATGRFTSRDPILQSGGLNVYAYVNGNPLSHRDPTGLAEGGGFMGFLQSIGDYFTSGDGGTAVDVVSSIDSDSPIVEGANKLSDGMDKLETIQDVADTALEVKEALDEPTDPEQAAGLLKCGLKWIKKILPVELTPTEAAEQALDQGMEHAKHQRDFGTINRGAASQMAQIEW